MKHVVIVGEIDDNETLPEMPGTKVKYIGMTPGIRVRQLSSGEEAFIPYGRWFDEENSTNWSRPEFDEYNWLFLRTQQNWANDILRARGHLLLNDAHDVLGLSRTAMGAVVGWIRDESAFVDFGCWEQQGQPFNSEKPGAILLDFNVQGPILHALK